MKFEGKIECIFETKQTGGKEIEDILEDQLKNMQNTMDYILDDNYRIGDARNVVQTSITARKDGIDMIVELESEYGNQQTGYLIKLKISFTERGTSVSDNATEAMEEVYSDTVDILKKKPSPLRKTR
jgi:hypothetical protein